MNMGQPIQLRIYLNYHGHCEAAFRFYEEYLGGTITLMSYHLPELADTD